MHTPSSASTGEARTPGSPEVQAQASAGPLQQRPAVLFVCLGNICRSPMAEGIARRELTRRALTGWRV
ncbi:MAG: hypothetical protein ACKOPS_19530, partial [Cyanobium sp.]